MLLNTKKKQQGLKFNPGLALIGPCFGYPHLFFVFAVFITYFFTARSNYFHDPFNSSGHGS